MRKSPERSSCNSLNLTGAMACRTGYWFGTFFSTSSVTFRTEFKMVKLNLFRNTENSFFKSNLNIDPQIIARLRSIRVRSAAETESAAKTAEKAVKYIIQITKTALKRPAGIKSCIFQSVFTVAVVCCPFVVIHKGFICFAEFFKSLFRIGSLINIGVKCSCFLPES